MVSVKIREPFWKYQAVGIAERKIVDDLCIEILYKDKSGNRLYPNKFYIKKDHALMRPGMVVKNTPLKIIKICDLQNELLEA